MEPVPSMDTGTCKRLRRLLFWHDKRLPHQGDANFFLNRPRVVKGRKKF